VRDRLSTTSQLLLEDYLYLIETLNERITALNQIIHTWAKSNPQAALLDTFSRRIIGLSMSAYRDETLVMAALRMALAQRVLVGDLIHHTDRGSQSSCSLKDFFNIYENVCQELSRS
jgi:hypothetical protein